MFNLQCLHSKHVEICLTLKYIKYVQVKLNLINYASKEKIKTCSLKKDLYLNTKEMNPDNQSYLD